MKKGGKKKRETFRIILTIKRPMGEFVMVAEGYNGAFESKYAVQMCAHVKTTTGTLRRSIDAESDFLSAHMREIMAMVTNSYVVSNEYGRTVLWK